MTCVPVGLPTPLTPLPAEAGMGSGVGVWSRRWPCPWLLGTLEVQGGVFCPAFHRSGWGAEGFQTWDKETGTARPSAGSKFNLLPQPCSLIHNAPFWGTGLLSGSKYPANL